jgi:regulator of sigma E protease
MPFQMLFSVLNCLLFGLAGIVGISLVVAFHELGHFLFCKLFHIKTPSFSIGFGPRLLTKKIGHTEFAISAIPLGGYVEIAGAAEVGQGEQLEAHSAEGDSFKNKPWYQKFLVMIGGIFFNLILAYATCSLLFLVGMPASPMLYPKNALPIIEVIKKNSPAQEAGLQAQDRIKAINNRPITEENTQSLIEELAISPGKTIRLLIARPTEQSSEELTVDVPVQAKEFLGETIGSIGVSFQTRPLAGLGLVASITEGITLTNKLLYNSIIGFKYIFSSGDTSMIAGPVMLISQTTQGAKKGIKTFFLFLAYVSIGLAVINILPLPIFDGGQIVFYTIEAIIGRSIPDRTREIIHIACWVALLALILFLTYNDLKNLLSPHLNSILNFFGLGK